MKLGMKSAIAAAATVLASASGLLLASGPAAAAPSEAQVQQHVGAAERAAGSDLQAFFSLCKPASPQRPSLGDAALARLIATPGPEAAAAFDNLYYLGSGWVSAWLLKTSDGLVLIDALNTAEEVDRLIVGGMKKLGLDPKQIKLLVITHGHGDHYGGARRIQEIVGGAGVRVVMSEQDWRMTATQLEFASPLWPAAPVRDPQRDLAAREGDVIRQGDSTLTMHITPGHTLGTLSPVIEVREGGRMHRALIWGGTGFNFGRDFDRLDAYIASTLRMQQVVRDERIDVLLSNHPNFDGSVAKLAALQRGGGASNPYVVGTDTVLRALTVAGECARANRVRFEMLP